jgi:hypothetical protein
MQAAALAWPALAGQADARDAPRRADDSVANVEDSCVR